MATSACPAGPPGDTQPPTTPTGLAVTSAGQTMIALNWTAATDNVGITGYGVYENGSLIASPATTGYTLIGLTCGTSYTLSVDAYDAAGNRSNTATITTSTTACPDTSPPTTPTSPAVTATTQTSITVSWAASSDNVGVTGYRLYQNGTQAGTTTGTSYTLGGLTCATSYTLAVAAVDAAGNVSAQTTLSATTNACPDVTPPSAPSGLSISGVGQTAVTLSWAASNDNVGVTGYRLYQGGSQVGTSLTTSYLFSGLVCGTAYTFAVAAVDAAGNVSAQTTLSATTNACPDVTPPSAPSGLSMSGVGQTAVTLSWAASNDNVGVTGYRLYQGGSQVGTSLTTSYLFSGLVCGTAYTFAVAAVDAAGNLSPQATALATTSACSPPPVNVNGASLATCTPSPCTAGTSTQYTINVGDSDGYGGTTPKIVTRKFYIDRPVGLTNSTQNKAPLVLDVDTSTGTFHTMAPVDKFVLAQINPSDLRPSGQFATPTTDPVEASASIDTHKCGTLSTALCDDIPFVKAVLDTVIASQNIDTNKVYIVGASKGGGFAMDIMCDQRTSHYFTAGVSVSWSMYSTDTSGSQSVPPACPEVMGTVNSPNLTAGLGGTGSDRNNNFSFAWYFGDNDGVGCPSTTVTCFNTGVVRGGRWFYANPQLAGEASPASGQGATGIPGGSRSGFGYALGCGSSPATTAAKGTQGIEKIYTGCTHSNRATETVLVHTGGHAWTGVTVGGFDPYLEAWNFLENYGG